MFKVDDLKRIMVGKSAGLIGIFEGPGTSGKKLFTKRDGLDMGEDLLNTEEEGNTILADLGVTDTDQALNLILSGYSDASFPKRAGVAVLGTLNNLPDAQMATASKTRLQRFLSNLLEHPGVSEDGDTANVLRRQALVALNCTLLATDVQAALDVARLLERTNNHFVVASAGRFFETQAPFLRQSPKLPELLTILDRGLEHPSKDRALAALTQETPTTVDA